MKVCLCMACTRPVGVGVGNIDVEVLPGGVGREIS